VFSLLTCPKSPTRGSWSIDVSPDGRLIAEAMEDEIRIWDCRQPRQPVSLPGGCRSAIFTLDGNDLVTCGSGLLARWPIHRVLGRGTNEVRFGPRQTIQEGLDFSSAALSPDDCWVAAANGQAGAISTYGIRYPTNRFALVPHPATAFPAISRDGKWVASGTWKGSGVRVWEFESRRVVCDLPTSPSVRVSFSPDNRWLVTGGASYDIWEVGSWKRKYTLSRDRSEVTLGSMAFSPDGQTLALARSSGIVDLVIPGTGELLARLEAPRSSNLYYLRFAPDGSQLFALEWDQQIQVWDLRRVRAELGKLGLDWNSPPFPEATSGSKLDSTPIEISVVAGPAN
jgi:WD40 repeat protein